jgi:hypothetical protein
MVFSTPRFQAASRTRPSTSMTATPVSLATRSALPSRQARSTPTKRAPVTWTLYRIPYSPVGARTYYCSGPRARARRSPIALGGAWATKAPAPHTAQARACCRGPSCLASYVRSLRFPGWTYPGRERAPSRRPRPSRWPDGERWRVVKTKLLAYSVGAASSRRRVADVPVLAAGRDVEDVARLSPNPAAELSSSTTAAGSAPRHRNFDSGQI